MKFSHTEDQRENQHLDILTDEENGMRIVVSRLGAELVSLARVNETGEWTGFLYRDNDLSARSQGWANHATVMVTISIGLKTDAVCTADVKSRAGITVSSAPKHGTSPELL